MTVDGDDALRRARLRVLAALVLLVAAGFRHHLVWGESERLPWLLPLLHGLEGACLVGYVALAGTGWWRALAVAARRAVPLSRLVPLTAPVLLAAVLVPCFLSADPIDYVVRGRILGVHGENPYLRVASDFPGDPFLGFGDAGWKDMPLPYGPIVANVQAAIAWFAHQLPVPPRVELIVALVVFKLLFALALLASAIALHGLAERLRPGAGAHAFLAVAWNPLLLDECVANAHNEPLLMLCLVVAVASAVAGRFAVSTIALGVGAMTKVVPVVLGPLWLVLAARRRRWGALLLGAAAAAAVAALFYLQFFRDPGAFAALQRQAELEGGSLWWAVHRATGLDLDVLVRMGRGAVLAWIVWSAVRLWRRPEPRELLVATASTLLLLAVLGTALFGVWYHAWWLPFALLLRDGYLYRAGCIASVVGPLAFLVWAGMRRLDAPHQWWGFAVAVVVPLLGALRRGRRATRA